jgi:hypothetical protein
MSENEKNLLDELDGFSSSSEPEESDHEASEPEDRGIRGGSDPEGSDHEASDPEVSEPEASEPEKPPVTCIRCSESKPVESFISEKTKKQIKTCFACIKKSDQKKQKKQKKAENKEKTAKVKIRIADKLVDKMSKKENPIKMLEVDVKELCTKFNKQVNYIKSNKNLETSDDVIDSFNSLRQTLDVDFSNLLECIPKVFRIPERVYTKVDAVIQRNITKIERFIDRNFE